MIGDPVSVIGNRVIRFLASGTKFCGWFWA